MTVFFDQMVKEIGPHSSAAKLAVLLGTIDLFADRISTCQPQDVPIIVLTELARVMQAKLDYLVARHNELKSQ